MPHAVQRGGASAKHSEAPAAGRPLTFRRSGSLGWSPAAAATTLPKRTVTSRLAASIRQVTRDKKDLGPTEPDTGRGWFLLNSGFNESGYYQAACGVGLIPTETQFPCRTLAACLVTGALTCPCPSCTPRSPRR